MRERRLRLVSGLRLVEAIGHAAVRAVRRRLGMGFRRLGMGLRPRALMQSLWARARPPADRGADNMSPKRAKISDALTPGTATASLDRR